jgi:hypothetical protein
MQRSSPVSSSKPDAPAPVPDTQAVLQAALAASWQRDQRVGRRRTALRWLIWGLWRCAPVVLVFALAWAAWRWLVPEIHTQQGARAQNQSASQHASARSTPPASYGALGTTASLQYLSLKPANRLHSKES